MLLVWGLADQIRESRTSTPGKLSQKTENEKWANDAPQVDNQQEILRGEKTMGFIKGCLKAAGTVVLAATGTASTVLKGMSDAAGIELGSEIFGAAKDASFNGIRSMWDGEAANEAIDAAQEKSFGAEDAARRKMADTAYQMAQTARRNGDMEKYETYMEKYEQYK